MQFKLKSSYKPAGSQPEAIKELVLGLDKDYKNQTLLGVTGSGKTFTVANVIEKVQMPTLVIAHNKTLAAQLCNEFREFFPNNAVEYFVSYYDYYQPEAYMPGSDTYIEKEAQINEEIDRLRHACTQALITRNDVIVVASVSAIYNLGNPLDYEKTVLHLEVGQSLDRRGMLEKLISMQFDRNDTELKRGQFRMRGQVFEIMPVNEELIYRFEISDKIDLIEIVDPITRNVKANSNDAWFFPAKHYVINEEEQNQAFQTISSELEDRLNTFKKQGKALEYERLKRKVKYDLEMIKEVGYCNGIENYSRHFDGRKEGEPAFTLIDYFKYAAGTSPAGTASSQSTSPNRRGNYGEIKMKVSRIEGYDISNLGSSGKVGSMVVFSAQGGSASGGDYFPEKSAYRKFKIKTVEGQSDVDCLREVLERRIARILTQNDADRWPAPDVILIDGGKPQVNAAMQILKKHKLNIPLVGIAKGPERKRNDFIFGVKTREFIKFVNENQDLLIRVRDEAHRFAITFQRSLRKLKHKNIKTV